MNSVGSQQETETSNEEVHNRKEPRVDVVVSETKRGRIHGELATNH